MRSEPSSCFIIGLGPLCIQCAAYMLDHGIMEVRGLISADEAVIEFGRSRRVAVLQIGNKVNYAASKGEIEAFLTRSGFDYLFSIINAMPLPEAIIRLPRKLAINFHDSELPKYAGIDATSWALMRGESRHAVTWHLMVRGIDEGDIVKQREVPIEKRDTAFMLSDRCLEAGLASFADLAADIKHDTIECRPQSAHKRSYYSRSKPHLAEMSIWNHGVVSWRHTAEEIDALTRALDYGPSRNALGTAKIFIGGHFYILPSVTICDTTSDLPPGTVLRCDADGLMVSTSSSDVWVNGVLTIEGRPISIAALAAKHHMAEGMALDEVSPNLLRRIKELDKQLMWKEAYWADAMKDCTPIPASYECARLIDRADPSSATATVRVLERTREELGQVIREYDLDLCTLLFAAFSSFLTTEGSTGLPIWYSDDEYRREVIGLTKLVSAFALCRLKVDDASSILEHYRETKRQVSEVKQMKHFLFDIAYRYPQLRDGGRGDRLRQCAFVFHGVSDRPGDWSMEADAFELALEVIGDTRAFSIRVNVARGGVESARRLAEQFGVHLEAVVSNPDTPLCSNDRLRHRICA